jgi:hypothetical protein
VNVAQEELNTFLSVAEDLRVKVNLKRHLLKRTGTVTNFASFTVTFDLIFF